MAESEEVPVKLTRYEMGVILLAIRDRAYGGSSPARNSIRRKLKAARSGGTDA